MIKYVVLLTFLLQLANALYFHIAETERKCFIEEIPDETTVIGKQSLRHVTNILPTRLQEAVLVVTAITVTVAMSKFLVLFRFS